MNELLQALRAAGESTRLRILAALKQSELTVSELTQILGQSQPRVSRHLKLLCDSGLLERYQEGAWVFHRISDRESIRKITNGLLSLIDLNDPALARDQKKLQEIRQDKTRRAAEYFSQHAEEWDSIRSLMVSDEAIENRLLEMTEPVEADLFLDLGTGTGRILQIFGPRIQKGIGFDLSRAMLSVARSNLENAGITNCTVRLSDICSIDLPDECADIITVHQVLHYCDNPEEAIGEAGRLLHQSGKLLIVDLLPHDNEMLRERHAHQRLGFAPEHVERWCTQYGLKVNRLETLPHQVPERDSLTVGLWEIAKQG